MQVLVCPPAPKCAACPACKKCPACVCKAPPPTQKTTLQFVLQPGNKHKDKGKKAVDGLRVREVRCATVPYCSTAVRCAVYGMVYGMRYGML